MYFLRLDGFIVCTATHSAIMGGVIAAGSRSPNGTRIAFTCVAMPLRVLAARSMRLASYSAAPVVNVFTLRGALRHLLAAGRAAGSGDGEDERS